MNNRRHRPCNAAPRRNDPVLYWMNRDQRTRDNWALLHAQNLALDARVPLIVCFCLAPNGLDASWMHHDFLLRGLKPVASALAQHRIPFLLRIGWAERIIPELVHTYHIGTIVTDMSPLRSHRHHVASVAALPVPLIEVDAHNIVPVWHASAKREYGAYTLRPKLHRLLGEFMDDYPALVRHPFPIEADHIERSDWEAAYAAIRVPHPSQHTAHVDPGEDAADRTLAGFISRKLSAYGSQRNDPTLEAQSHLSPYIHFGQISAQRIALDVQRHAGVQAGSTSAPRHGAAAEDDQPADPAAASATNFLEELIVRRELADNFCFYEDRYDSFDGFPAWARQTLNEHRNDTRMQRYDSDVFEEARTRDPLWNAAQRQLLSTGRMHGYMRMYWAKKLLEWTGSPEEGMAIAVYLNDRYSLDGVDPNGYAGIAWSIGGVHDRAWFERPVFGKIRYMSASGCMRKFDVKKYCAMYGGT